MITGKDLIAAGFEPGSWFGDAIESANKAAYNGTDWLSAVYLVESMQPRITGLDDYDKPLDINITVENDVERKNFDNVLESMKLVLKTPGTVEGAIMPDACPAGPLGTIPVGGVVSSKYIHPGMHSADICCSMFASYYPEDTDPEALLDSFHSVTHFGAGGRDKIADPPQSLTGLIKSNFYTRDFADVAQNHFMTQGDGNHFAFVGLVESTGEVALVTHHGSRGFGAKVYKRAMEVAEKYRKKYAPEVLRQNAWLEDANGDYLEALQIVREWTYENHFYLHAYHSLDMTSWHWNEHNFVFKRDDGLFYHAKGATPAYDNAIKLVPMNMRDGILVIRGRNKGMGFAPHGAGRNMSRTKHKAGLNETLEQTLARETAGLYVSFYSGVPDVGELPSAYKSAGKVEADMARYGLCDVVDRIKPYGCIMAGEQPQTWRKK